MTSEEASDSDWKVSDWLAGIKPDTVVHSSLPSGEAWDATAKAHRTVWDLWRRLTAYALRHGMGVSVAVDVDGNVQLETVYAPLWEGHRFVISPGGEVSDCSEQSAEPV